MCDYSLQHVASRPAKIEDKLVVTKFNRLYHARFRCGRRTSCGGLPAPRHRNRV